MALSPKDELVKLGFGADEQVKVERVVSRRINRMASRFRG